MADTTALEAVNSIVICPGGEMADTTALEAVAARHGGSSPLLGTRKFNNSRTRTSSGFGSTRNAIQGISPSWAPKQKNIPRRGIFYVLFSGLEANLNAALRQMK